MRDDSEIKLILLFVIAYMIFFIVLAIVEKNFEFLYYTFFVSIMIIIIALYYKKIHLTKYILFGLAVLGILHLCGGTVYISGTRLYDFWLIPGVLKYDQLVHAFGIFVATFVVYSFIRPHLDMKIKHNHFLLSLVLILMALGIGALNEILELGAVVFLNAGPQVGDYMNNALDLVFNMIGSIIACFFIIKYHKKG